jgi:hypothetical protein
LRFIALWREKAKVADGHPFDADNDLGCLTFAVIQAAALGLSDQNDASLQFSDRLRNTDSSSFSAEDKDTPFPFPSMEKPELLTAMATIGHAASECYKQPFPGLFYLINNQRPTMKKAFKSKTTIIQSYIDRSIQRISEEGASFQPKSAIDYMVSREDAAAKKAGRKPDFHSSTMNEGVFGYLLGGQDSTHSTLTFSKLFAVHT